jgi:hypothetical protein
MDKYAAKRRRRWIVCALTYIRRLTASASFLHKIIGSTIALAVLIAVGVALGVVLSKNNDSSQGSGNSTQANDNGSGSNNSNNSSDSNDPSVFAKDPRLHKSLYGMAYTPEGSLMPNCGNSLGV